MFEVKLNEQNRLIQVKQVDDGNNESSVIAEGCFIVDPAGHIALIIITHIKILVNDPQLDGFITSILSHVGKTYCVAVFLRLSMFDGQIDMDKLQFKNIHNNIMVVTMAHVKHDNDLVHFDQEHYELITDKQILLDHSQRLTTMINENKFAHKEWDCRETRDRINTASHVAMIVDKTKNVPCGIGRSLVITSTIDSDERLAYLSTIRIDSRHQRKGLGSVIFNYLVKASINEDHKWHTNGLLCLICGTEGVGAVAGPKLYKKQGFEFISEVGNRVALFYDKQYFVRS